MEAVGIPVWSVHRALGRVLENKRRCVKSETTFLARVVNAEQLVVSSQFLALTAIRPRVIRILICRYFCWIFNQLTRCIGQEYCEWGCC
jgi:hypothetical protein